MLNELSCINDSLDLSINVGGQNVFLENSFRNDFKSSFSLNRPHREPDSKNSTLSFKHLNIESCEENFT